MDKTGEQFWTKYWRERKLPPPIRVRSLSPRAWFYQEFHRLWEAHLPRSGPRALRLLEIGCAGSRWLPYFAREWGYEVCGLDYSELGCELARCLLAREGVTGEIWHQDLFCPRPRQLGAFDVVFSNGVVEHFNDPAEPLRQMAAYLRPGGLMVTIVPNFTGWLGWLQSWVSPEILAVHTPLDREDLARAHAAAGLRVRFCDYLTFLHFSVVHPGGRWQGWSKTCFFKALKGATALSLGLHRLWPRLRLDRRTAGFVVCIAVKAQVPRI